MMRVARTVRSKKRGQALADKKNHRALKPAERGCPSMNRCLIDWEDTNECTDELP